ncbi:hypothetical protein H920_13121 [Fukomys damarensis]|uniref:Uncharacterized protein n=1 Tax=Fukomys damarensis TaxID=885580 RepID=A0A091D538_FUKDA|nr:hypothetical protein H920_13121 [Fukomys damarensis]
MDRLGHQLEDMLLSCKYRGELCGPHNFSSLGQDNQAVVDDFRVGGNGVGGGRQASREKLPFRIYDFGSQECRRDRPANTLACRLIATITCAHGRGSLNFFWCSGMLTHPDPNSNPSVRIRSLHGIEHKV